MAQLLRKTLRALFNVDPSFCDMYEDADSRLAASEYLEHVRRHLRERFGDRHLSILDAGCQAGRLLIPLAQDGHRLMGIDTSMFALRRARQHAQEAAVSVELHRGNIARLRRWAPPSSLDVVICTEVLYLCEAYHQLLEALAASVKPGGLLFISHRATLYYVASAMARGHPEQASAMLRRSEGASPDGAYHNWQTQEQLVELYRALPVRLLACYPVGYVPRQADLSTTTDEMVKQFLAPMHQGDSTFRVPTYLLAVSQKTDPARRE